MTMVVRSRHVIDIFYLATTISGHPELDSGSMSMAIAFVFYPYAPHQRHARYDI